jgi:hypothetical protein
MKLLGNKRYIQVVNGIVVNLYDTPPPDAELNNVLGEDGWKEAMEDYPEIDERWQEYGQIEYKLDVNPPIVTRGVKIVPIDDRKNGLLEKNKEDFLLFAEASRNNSSLYTEEEIEQAKLFAKENKIAIQSCETHEQLNDLVIKKIELF